jgi:hypothetical protein
MDEKLWASVELKLVYAEFHFDMMGRAIQPPKQNSIYVALQASGAIIDTGWQRCVPVDGSQRSRDNSMLLWRRPSPSRNEGMV